MVSLVVKTGRTIMRNRTFGLPVNEVSYMGLGSSMAVPTDGSAGLGAEIDTADYYRAPLLNTDDPANDITVSEATFDVDNIKDSITIREFALFDSFKDGKMFLICQCGEEVKNDTKALLFRVTTETFGE
jgi:hypothetical protein